MFLKLPAALPPPHDVVDEGVADGRPGDHLERESLVIGHDCLQQLQRRLRYLWRSCVDEHVVQGQWELRAVGEEPPTFVGSIESGKGDFGLDTDFGKFVDCIVDNRIQFDDNRKGCPDLNRESNPII